MCKLNKISVVITRATGISAFHLVDSDWSNEYNLFNKLTPHLTWCTSFFGRVMPIFLRSSRELP